MAWRLEAVAVVSQCAALASRLSSPEVQERTRRRVLKNGCSLIRARSLVVVLQKAYALDSVPLRVRAAWSSAACCCWLPSRGKMKNLTWKGNEWQGLLFVYACFLMLLGWLAKLRSRFHPKKFLIKCWCACLRLLLRSAWNDFGLRSQLLFSWFKCRPTDARTTTRTVHPLALPTITSLPS